jgi:hypothetical protein
MIKVFGDFHVFSVENLPEVMKTWVKSNCPETIYVNFGLCNELDNKTKYNFWGWNTTPTVATYRRERSDWQTTFTVFEEPKKADEPKFPRADVESIYMNRDKQVSINGGTVYPVNNLPDSMKMWVKTNYPDTVYVNFGPSCASKNGMAFGFWGWNQEPANYTPDGYSWRTTFESVKEECVNDSIQVPESEWNDYLVSCNYNIFNVNNPSHYTDPKKLPPTLKRWMESHPYVQYVVWSPNDDNTLTIKGLDYVDYKEVSKWNRKVKIIKNTAPVAPPTPAATTEETVAAQLTALTEAITALTKLVSELPRQ